jgi:hypothetical protein
MHREKQGCDRCPLRSAGIALGLLLLMIASSPGALAQQVPGGPNGAELIVADVLKLPGKLLAEGRNTQPAGQFRLLTYRLEEVPLPRSVTVVLRGQPTQVDTAWRLTVTGGPFAVRALPAVIWIDDQVVGYGAENERLSAVTAVTFDRSLLRDGGTISLSYGDDRQGRVQLPEKLNLSGVR